MTLLELLVNELHKYGGWPDGAVECVRYVDEANIYFYDENVNWDDDCLLTYGAIAAELVRKQVIPCEHEQVTLEQYESALAASQKVEWDGEGLPQVGCEVEYIPGMLCPASYDDNKPIKPTIIKIVAHEKYPNGGNDVFVGVWIAESGGMRSSVFSPQCCVPVRTEAERKRDDICDSIYGAMTNAERKDNRSDMAEAIYDAIAAGKIPGVKLED